MNNVKVELEHINCDFCGSDRYTCLFEARDYRFGRAERYNVVLCKQCGLIYINPRPNTESISNLYRADYTSDDKTLILPQIETRKIKRILKKIWHRINGQYHDEVITKAEGRVLDVGCGSGNLLLPLKQRGSEVYGVETNPKLAKACNELGLNVFCGTLEEANHSNGFFDTVILSQVVEHFPSPKNSLKEIRRILKPGGRLYIYCPNVGSYLSKLFGKYWHGWHIPFHFYAFNKDTIKSIAKEAGFMVEKINTITPTHFFTVSLKSYLWGEDDRDISSVHRGKLFDSLFVKACIAPIFRLLDLVLHGRGDCLKVVLQKKVVLDDKEDILYLVEIEKSGSPVA